MVSKIEREGERYRSLLNRTLRDGRVTSAEVDALIRDATDGTFAEVDAHYLAGFVDHARDKFEPAAREKLSAFVSAKLGKLGTETVAGDDGLKSKGLPRLTTDDQKAGSHVEWNAHPGKVVVGGVSADDPMQGQVGDCYFISSLAALAHARPELLARAITANDDGTFTVTFHERKAGATTTHPVAITVDGTLPTKRGQLEYATARDAHELWPMLFEKAYATWKGGYDAIEGGMAATALEALSGARGAFFPVTAESSAGSVFTKLKDACADGGCVVALSKPWSPSRQGVVADHAYTVLGVKEENGQKLVQLRNPWGEREPGNDGRDDGVFWLPMADFLGSFASVEHARP
jgi:Calpain family cysteine protease